MKIRIPKFRTIVLDPPWYERGGGQYKRGADKHYKLLKTPDIYRVISTSPYFSPEMTGCHLYLWVTNNFLKDGLWLMDKLGFRYITNLCWAKNHIGLGYYFRGQHELCLFGIVGKMASMVRNSSTLIVEDKTVHSRKPDKFFHLVEVTSPGPRLEMFSRTKRDNWVCVGDEVKESYRDEED